MYNRNLGSYILLIAVQASRTRFRISFQARLGAILVLIVLLGRPTIGWLYDRTHSGYPSILVVCLFRVFAQLTFDCIIYIILPLFTNPILLF
jgi:hypothetical protein